MPITPSKGYTTSDGAMHATLESAQMFELGAVLDDAAKALEFEHWHGDISRGNATDGQSMAGWIVANRRDTILDILALGPRSRVASRKRAGTSNPKRAAKAGKTDAEDARVLKRMSAVLAGPAAVPATPEQAEAGRLHAQAKADYEKAGMRFDKAADGEDARARMGRMLASPEQAEAGFKAAREAVETAP